VSWIIFFFQAEDGIRDFHVTGVQTCALPILTAYIAPIARMLDDALDMILVGDSTAMVGYALPDTLSISAETLAAHGAAVVRATRSEERRVGKECRSGAAAGHGERSGRGKDAR